MKTAHLFTYAIFFSLTATVAIADDFKTGNIIISDPMIRLTISNRPAAGFMVINNAGNTQDRIISATSPAAQRIELHTHTMKDGIMRMRPVKGVDIPAKSQVAFKSGGYHMMVFGLKPTVKPGDKISITVFFEKTGALEIKAPVKSLMKMKRE